MSGFSNTTYTDTVESLISGMKEKISANPYYKWSDKAPTPVTYLNINKYKSTLDEAAKITFSEISSISGIYWNRINNFMLYGIDSQVQLTLSNDDFGAETQAIEGDAFILPGTITPYAGDLFFINHVDEKLIFEIIDATPDTLENGSNIYKIQYKTSAVKYDEDTIKNITADTYDFIVDNVGTNYNSVMKSEVMTTLEKVYEYIIKLQRYYKDVFYNQRVQAFTYKYLEGNFYDPYMVEFILNNDLINNTNDMDYLYICHQTTLEPTFSLKYMRTLFYALENNDKNSVPKCSITAFGYAITGINTTFYTRIENYFEIKYDDPYSTTILSRVPCISQELITAIKDNTVFKHKKECLIYNIIIKYFNNLEITQEDLNALFDIDSYDSIVLFYMIPCILYCLKKHVSEVMTKNTKNI